MALGGKEHIQRGKEPHHLAHRPAAPQAPPRADQRAPLAARFYPSAARSRRSSGHTRPAPQEARRSCQSQRRRREGHTPTPRPAALNRTWTARAADVASEVPLCSHFCAPRASCSARVALSRAESVIAFSSNNICSGSVNATRREASGEKHTFALRRTYVNKRAMRDEDDERRCAFTGMNFFGTWKSPALKSKKSHRARGTRA
jgi:hypothetical protein